VVLVAMAMDEVSDNGICTNVLDLSLLALPVQFG